MIFLSSITFDLEGTADIDALANSDAGTMTRRTNRVATLDGGVAVNDFGYTDADRDLTVRMRLTEELDNTLRYIVRNHGQIHVSTSEGFFKAIPSYSARGAVGTISLSITEQLA
jgi:hypothetical protein